VCVCLSVCLFICLPVCSHISKILYPDFTKFYVHVSCAVARSYSDGNAKEKRKGKEEYLYSTILCIVSKRSDIDHTFYLQIAPCLPLCTSGFMDDVMFSHNGANRPEPTTTRMFRPVRQVAAPGANSAVSDCILSFLTLRNVGWPGLPEPTKSSSYHSRTVMVIPFSPFSNGRFILGDPAFSYVFAQVDLPLKTFSMETPCNSM